MVCYPDSGRLIVIHTVAHISLLHSCIRSFRAYPRHFSQSYTHYFTSFTLPAMSRKKKMVR